MNVLIFIKPVLSKYVSSYSNNQEKWVLNPYDLYALSSIVRLKDKIKSLHITCISMGVIDSKEVLVRCLALGADEGILLSDKVIAGSDTYATSYILHQAVKKIDSYDFIVCGKQAVDGETGQVGFGLAYRLDIPCFAQVKEIIEVNERNIIFLQEQDEYEEIIRTKLPVLLSFNHFVIHKSISLMALKKASKKSITVWNHEDIKADVELCGSKGSKTKVLNISQLMEKKHPIVIEGTCEEKARKLLSILKVERGK